MQIVIDINDEVYEDIINGKSMFGYVIRKIIRDGKPLPKGHGNLVDFDKLCEEYWDGNYMEIHKDDLSNIKPVIEADRED